MSANKLKFLFVFFIVSAYLFSLVPAYAQTQQVGDDQAGSSGMGDTFDNDSNADDSEVASLPKHDSLSEEDMDTDTVNDEKKTGDEAEEDDNNADSMDVGSVVEEEPDYGQIDESRGRSDDSNGDNVDNIDYDSEVEGETDNRQADESNKLPHPSGSVGGGPALPESKPDLVLDDIYYDGTTYIKVKYCNVGDDSSDSDFLIKLRNEGTTDEFAGNPSYRFSVPAPGECDVTGGFTCALIGVDCGQRVTVSAVIDWEGRVEESDEDNNKLVKTIGAIDVGYEENCNGADCADNLNCKPDLWSAESICCKEDECAGDGKCFAEYACVSRPVKLCYNGGWIDVLDYEVNCVDGIDNDCDGVIDEQDTDCYNSYVCGNGICEESETVSACPRDCSKGKTIIIRNDDIGPWWSVDNAIYVTNFLRNKGIPQTLGIVPITAGGTIQLEQDPKLVSYLKSISTDAKIEIAIHGLNHDYNEFLGISQHAAEEKIRDAKEMIKKSLYVEPVTFIPPYYAYDESTLYAANSQGMNYFSAGWNAIDMGHGFREYPPGLWNIPATTDFYNWGTGSLYSAQEIESSCGNAMDAFETCVIVVHSHLFVDTENNIDPEKIALLAEVLDWVKSKEEQGVELKTIGKHKILPAPPPKKKYIVFRSDDLGPFWSDRSAINITETLRARNVPQVLSVVPANQYNDKLYDDPVISDYLKSIRSDKSIEFALHGYDHSMHEFRDISYAIAMTKVFGGRNILERAIGARPVTFVPPFHEYSDNTLMALSMQKINIISSGYDDFAGGRAFKKDKYGILHLPVTAEFYNWAENRANTAEDIENSCEYALGNYNICIIMLHHHLFKDASGNMDPAKVKVLTDVADWAKDKEAEGSAKIVLLKDIRIDD
ncbi:MAG: hypothetical protein DRN71_01475 [Candidatus Nanohalarchaeota archaeon]|nr:MAG: hypothetical protein DRN71_01475 [Candidatus Nanohaloarchaeota archaeon]